MTTETVDTTKPHKFAISKELRDAIRAVAEMLSDEIGEHRDAWEDKSERWQESERGEAVDTWMAELDEFWEKLDEPPLTPDV